MRKLTLLFLATMFSIIAANAQGARILGYLPDYRDPNTVQYNKVTDVVFSFMNPNTNGTIITTNTGSNLYSWNSGRFTIAKNKCQQNGVSMWIGVGGADDNEFRAARLNQVSGNTTYRTTFAKQLIDFANANGAVGVIIDWEFPKHSNEKANHLKLMQALYTYRNANAPNIKIGLAVGGEYKNSVNHLQYVDPSFFSTNANLIDEWHIMAYDFPASYGVHHSSLADGTASADAWKNKGVPASKMLLAVPFYARNSARNAINYNALGGNAATNFNNDQANGYYYNGKATLEAKTDHIINLGGQGIVIWDLGQDRNDQYSLLNVIKNKMDATCTIQKPNLGPDAGVCNGQSVTLKSGVAAGGGLTFSWKKDGQTIAGSSPDLTVSTGGDYEVSITNGTCTKTDLVKVVSGASITATSGSACKDEDISLTINNPASGKVYDWYDAAVGGTQVHTGNDYTYTPNKANDGGKTFSFFVEERAAGTQTFDLLHVDVTAHSNYAWSTAWSGTTIGAKRAILVDAKKDLTLKSIRVYTKKDATTQFKITLLRPSDNNELQTTSTQTATAVAGAQPWEWSQSEVNLDFTVSAGKYFVVVELLNPGTGDFAFVGSGSMNDPANGSKAIESGVIEIADHVFTDFGSGFLENQKDDSGWDGYGSIYNLRVETGASTSCGRAEAVATVEDCLNFEELVAQYGVSVVPNPSSNEFTFSRGSLSGDVQVNVLTTSGDVVFSESVSNSTTFGSELTAGVYVVQIVNNGEVVSTKVVKQ